MNFKVGDRVRIVSKRPIVTRFNPFMDKWLGKIMTIKELHNTMWGELSYKMNEDSDELGGDGWYWYPEFIEGLVEEENKEETKMKPTGFTKAAKINTGGYKPYYYALYDETIKESDKVLVTGATSDRIHTVEDVVSVETALLEAEKPLCEEVICKVDTSAYDARVKQREQKAKLRKLMEATVAQMDEVDKFKVYAEHSPEMAKLLAQYNEINV